MKKWFKFFLGTPRRAAITIGSIVFLCLLCEFAPEVMEDICTTVAEGLRPILELIFHFGIVITILLIGLALIWKQLRKIFKF